MKLGFRPGIKKLRCEISNQKWVQPTRQLWVKVNDQILSQLDKNMKPNLYSSPLQDSRSNKLLRSLINYVFMLNQLRALALKNTKEFKSIENTIINALRENNLRDRRILHVLIELRDLLPSTLEENFLVETHLKLIRRQLV